MDKQPSFSERRNEMERIAVTLREYADGLNQFSVDLEGEAERMAAAEKRLADRRSAKAKASR